jgi:hypothetical protein
MTSISEIHTPCDWEDDAFRDITDPGQRRALALIHLFGIPGGGEKVCFAGDLIIIAAPPHDQMASEDIELCVVPLDEFLVNFSANMARDADPDLLRRVDDIARQGG